MAHARVARKLARLRARPRRVARRSPALDENHQLRLSAGEPAELDKLRAKWPGPDRGFFRLGWQERLRAARRVFDDPDPVGQIVTLLEAAAGG